MEKERKVVGSSYLYEFYEQMGQLNNINANYQNVVLELGKKLEDTESLSDEEQNVMKQWSQSLRHIANLLVVKYRTLKMNDSITAYKEEGDDKVLQAYEDMREKLIVDRDVSQEFTESINAFMFQETVQKLLSDSKSVMNALLSESENPASTE